MAEPLRNFGVPRANTPIASTAVLRRVRLTPPDAWLDRRPHELSGGQLQRVVLARALIPGPLLIVADEPVSMLDVSIRAGMLNLLREARDALGLAAIYISHDLALIRYVCERTLVMYLGRVVEEGPTAGADRRAGASLHRALWSRRSRCRARRRTGMLCRSAAACRVRRRPSRAARSVTAARARYLVAKLRHPCRGGFPIRAAWRAISMAYHDGRGAPERSSDWANTSGLLW